MQMKNLPMKRLAERHVEAAAAKLAVVHHDYTLKHVIVEALGHTVECADILIQRTHDINVVSRFEVRRQSEVGCVVANGGTQLQRPVGQIAIPLILNNPLGRAKRRWWRCEPRLQVCEIVQQVSLGIQP